MARPKSMPDFASLLDASYTPLGPEKERPRKKPSISLAAGLIMASETQSPKSFLNTPHETPKGQKDGWSEGLFYAYAQKSDYSQSPPFILTFASASVADQWWNLVQSEYPESTRVGPQLFILKGDDMQEQIQDNPKFYNLKNKWFYTAADATASGIIPLQDYKGNPVAAPPAPTPQKSEEEERKQKEASFDMASLSAALDKMNSMISENSAQIRALSVAQSEGLQRMQEINESNSGQIKALADGQAKLQTLMDQNAAHYIALSNSSFSNQEQVKTVLQTNADQIRALANGQAKLATTCSGLMKTIENLGATVGKVGETVKDLAISRADSVASSDAGSTAPFSSLGNRISPPPRKLNRRIKGVWYEYDASPASSPRRGVGFLETPPKSPSSTRT